MYFDIKIVLLVLVWIFMTSNKVKSEGFHWDEVVPVFNSLCIASEDCEGSTNEADKWRGLLRNPCCTGCDCCEDNSIESINKRFPGQTKCMSSIEDDRIDDVIRYRLVVSDPPTGCDVTMMSQMSPSLPCCRDDVNVAPWGGNFYPVYSSDMRINFKNELCARCHGAKDTMKWLVYAVFLGEESDRLNALLDFYKNFKSSDVVVGFYPPSGSSLDVGQTCNTIISRCGVSNISNFYIPSRINLTRAQIVQGCEEGPISLYVQSRDIMYKNIFCAICDGYVNIDQDSVRCEIDDSRNTILRPDLASMIDHEYIEAKREENIRETKKVLACPKKSALKTQKENICREVLCPTLQIRQQDGACGYPMEATFLRTVFVTINISTSEKLDTEKLMNLSKNETAEMFRKPRPWTSQWEIISVFLRTDIPSQVNRSEMVVTIGIEINDIMTTKRFVMDIQTAISAVWILNLDGMNYTFKQEFYAQGPFQKSSPTLEGGIEFYEPRWVLTNLNVPYLANLSSSTWFNLLTNDDSFHGNTEFTQLFYCDQVAYYADEFIGISDAFPVYLKRPKKYVYPSQFKMHDNEYGNKVVTICLEDSDFELVNAGNNVGIHVKLAIGCIALVFAVQQ